ncbi:MepB family protein [Chryseobacterium gwangjuense]|uniref:MepB family protein n=1 Tax=Chryseobacterium gwangjuense TaxID=1069980 RepID=UPI001E653390|nr:MepB family protein [Chryseobacterium gwangjuense]MCE3074706.1 MepB family protein [Chryseobacterium gwangjuense]
MIQEIEILQNTVLSPLQLSISHLHPDSECDEYLGYNFQVDSFHIKFRKAKITPKKTGQFVTLWKRNPETQETEPFDIEDHFDFCIILTAFHNQLGLFLFPKNILCEKQIVTTPSKPGKRGFRIYPDWDIPTNKQAQKTQHWQTSFFTNITEGNFLEKFNTILQTQFISKQL